MVGRFHDGTAIPGGPYTTTQIGMGVTVAGAMWFTKDLWGTGWVVLDVFLILPVAWLVAFLGGLLPIGARNPLMLLTGLLKTATHTAGRFDGQPLPRDKTTRTDGIQTAGAWSAGPALPQHEPVPADPRPVHADAPSRVPAFAGPATGLERLLLQTRTQKD